MKLKELGSTWWIRVNVSKPQAGMSNQLVAGVVLGLKTKIEKWKRELDLSLVSIDDFKVVLGRDFFVKKQFISISFSNTFLCILDRFAFAGWQWSGPQRCWWCNSKENFEVKHKQGIGPRTEIGPEGAGTSDLPERHVLDKSRKSMGCTGRRCRVQKRMQ